jgi:hypothetical protein
VRLFSPWEYNTDTAARALLEAHGWQEPPAKAMPTGSDLYEAYLRPLAKTPEVAAVIETGARVTAITRLGADKVLSKGRETKPFVLAVSNGNGSIRRDLARAVIDASGTWTAPNPLGAGGILAEGEARKRGTSPTASRRARTRPRHLRGQDDPRRRRRAFGRRTCSSTLAKLAGSGNPATSILWATRGENLMRVYGAGSADQIPARGELGSRLKAAGRQRTVTLVPGFSAIPREDRWRTGRGRGRDGGRYPRRVGPVDRIVVSTGGQRPDLNLTRELRLGPRTHGWESSKALGPLIDPNEHSCGSVPAATATRELAHPEPDLLHGRHQKLRARADLPDADGLRAGALRRGGHRRRPRRGQ